MTLLRLLFQHAPGLASDREHDSVSLAKGFAARAEEQRQSAARLVEGRVIQQVWPGLGLLGGFENGAREGI
jgi:hypothetical protein